MPSFDKAVLQAHLVEYPPTEMHQYVFYILW